MEKPHIQISIDPAQKEKFQVALYRDQSSDIALFLEEASKKGTIDSFKVTVPDHLTEPQLAKEAATWLTTRGIESQISYNTPTNQPI